MQRFELLTALFLFLLSPLTALGVGVALAAASGFPASLGVGGAAAGALTALILAAGCSRMAFAPEAGRWPRGGPLTTSAWRNLAYGCLSLAAVLGIVLQFVCRTGSYTFPLGGLGLLLGFFSFAPPIEWLRRPGGELAPALGLGLLPVLAGYYLQGGRLVAEMLLYGLPLTWAAFNVFLLQGLPHPDGQDLPVPSGLGARLSPVAVALVYTLVNLLTIAGLLLCIFFPASPLPGQPWLWGLILLALVNQELIKRRAYRRENRLRLVCGLTQLLHLGMGLVFAAGLWGRL
jgi:1,4-dihydroxy-2-naphthoate octaprenyltransferase